MIYDRTCTGDLVPGLRHRSGDGLGGRLARRVGERFTRVPGPGLSHSWAVGGALYSSLGRLDDWRGFDDWGSALRWLADYPDPRPIAEVQFWGHGKWGCARVDAERLDLGSLRARHAHHGPLAAIRDRMAPSQSQWWFRTCETFGAAPGQRFAREFVGFMGCRAAGHTYIIGPWQSGLHTLAPGEAPRWSEDEGLVEGTPEEPRLARWSARGEPNTVSFLTGKIPAGF
ncbi:hypothetical protein G6O69_34915 [Pseudenhygromyxa sp. WMMC2535]|nr:hypothetical protein [Pseudenhygromyxa sp. WMMC2535]NVB43067.1 hypothetical protein [Pseudenhygromyxa sp. WMMC2535]